jgi:hypothetical protein
MISHLAHRLNPVTIAREAWNFTCNTFIPQGAAELSQALLGQHQGYANIAAQSNLRPRMPDIKSVMAPSQGQTQGRSQGMSQGM